MPASAKSASTDDSNPPAERGGGAQTLLRGLDIIEAVKDGPLLLPELAERVGLTRSTAYRLANVLVERRYLSLVPRHGFRLGPKLIELGFLSQGQIDLVQTARPFLEDLSATTEDTVHLGVNDGQSALYLDKISGRRRVEISSRVGERQPFTSTGLGKALLLDENRDDWKSVYDREARHHVMGTEWGVWSERMTDYATRGRAYDLEENEDQIRCVAAPIRDARGRIVAAISLSSAAQYMDDDRMAALSEEVRGTAETISRELGYNPEVARRAR